MSESNRVWSVAERAFGEVPTTDVVVDPIAETPVPAAKAIPDTAYEALVEALQRWSGEYDLPFDEGGLIIGNDEDDDLRLVLPGMTLTSGGDIAVKSREYEWSGTVTIEVSVQGTVTARDDDDADGQVEAIMRALTIDEVELSAGLDEVEVQGYYQSDSSVDDIDEV